MSANRDGGQRGRYPMFPQIFGVQDTTRRVAASLKPRAVTSGLPPARAQNKADHVEEAEEPPTLLTQLVSARPDPLTDLHSLLPISHTFNNKAGFVALCNNLLVLNTWEHRDPSKRSINIPGTRIMVSPFQFYHAFHLLSQRGRDLQGGILADQAGTGKTHIFFTTCLLRALVFKLQRMVRLFWSGRGRKKLSRHTEQHLAEGANGRSCPSQRQGRIVCYCVPGSLTRTLCDLTLSGVSAIYCSNKTWPDILGLVQSAALSPSVYQLTLVHSNAPRRFTRPLNPLVRTLSRGAEADLRDPSPAAHIFVTTVNSPRLWDVFAEATPLNAGFVVVDEAHQVVRHEDSLMLRMAAQFSGGGADVWFVTATPFNGCHPADWIEPIRLIAPGRVAAITALGSFLQPRLVKSSAVPGKAQLFQDIFRNHVFDKNLVLRHLATSTFLGRPISDVQDTEPRIISRATPPQHRDAVQQLARQVADTDPRLRDPGRRGLLYLVSLFPAAAQLILDNPIAFKVAAIRDLTRQTKNRMRIEDSQPLRHLADQIVRDSPKLDYILEELGRMDQGRRERDRARDAPGSSRLAGAAGGAGEDPRLKKMVIITPTAVSAVFLYLALARRRRDVVLLHNWVSSHEKEQAVGSFASLSAAKLVWHRRVLVAPMAVAGTGVNLQAASYEVLTSPLPDRASQVQAFARTNRAGQRLRPLQHRILVLEDSPVDRVVLAAQAGVEVESDPFDISELLRVAGYNNDDNNNNDNNNVPLESSAAAASAGSAVGEEQQQQPSPSTQYSPTVSVDPALFQNAVAFAPGFAPAEQQHPPPSARSSPSLGIQDDAALFQNAVSFPPGGEHQDPSPSRKSSPTLGAGNAALFQSAVSFPPGPPAAAAQQGNEQRRRGENRSSAMNVDEALLLQTALTLSLRPAAPPRRPLPPLPTDNHRNAQASGPRHRVHVCSLQLPAVASSPARIAAGPTLASLRRHHSALRVSRHHQAEDDENDLVPSPFPEDDDDDDYVNTEGYVPPPPPLPPRQYGDDMPEQQQQRRRQDLAGTCFSITEVMRAADRLAQTQAIARGYGTPPPPPPEAGGDPSGSSGEESAEGAERRTSRVTRAREEALRRLEGR